MRSPNTISSGTQDVPLDGHSQRVSSCPRGFQQQVLRSKKAIKSHANYGPPRQSAGNSCHTTQYLGSFAAFLEQCRQIPMQMTSQPTVTSQGHHRKDHNRTEHPEKQQLWDRRFPAPQLPALSFGRYPSCQSCPRSASPSCGKVGKHKTRCDH